MKEKIKSLILFALVIVIAGMTICLYKQRQKLKTANELIENYETVSEHRTSPPDTVYEVIEKPSKLNTTMIPSTVTLPPSKKESTRDEVGVPKMTDSVAAVELNKNHFKFTFQDSLGNLSQLDYEIRPDKYQYIWVDGMLTTQKLPWHKRVSLKPFAEASYRPLNNLLDVEAGIKLKTQHINYSVGVNGFYYPKFQKNPGWDVKIGIQYEF